MYIKYIITDISSDEFDKYLNDYITTHNEKFDFYLISCELVIEFDNNFTENIETNYFYNTDILNIKRNILHIIYHFIPRVYKACNAYNIKQMILKTINDRWNMTYKYYINLPMSMVERRVNINIAKNPELINSLGRSKNHPLIRKYSPVPFNN